VPPPISERVGITESATSLHTVQMGIINHRMKYLYDMVNNNKNDVSMPFKAELLDAIRAVETDTTNVANAAWSGAIKPLALMHESKYNHTQVMLERFALHSDPGYGAGAPPNKIVKTDTMDSLIVIGDEATDGPLELSILQAQDVRTITAPSRKPGGTSGTGRASRKGKQPTPTTDRM